MASSLDDVKREMRRLQDELERLGEVAIALQICKALGDYYNSSTEALIGLTEALAATSATWSMRLPAQRARQVEMLMQEAKTLMDLS